MVSSMSKATAVMARASAAVSAAIGAAGLTTRTEEDVACCYAVQDKVWVQDPDGNAWEVFFVKGDADVLLESASPSEACCVPQLTSLSSLTKKKASSGCCG